MLHKCKAFVLAVLLCMASQKSFAQSTEERFQDVFITAGYATAFGAALGAAFLSFVPNPASELRYVAIGASLGFIGGSVLGSYMVFAPAIVSNEAPQKGLMLSQNTSNDSSLRANSVYTPSYQNNAQPVLVFQPGWDVSQKRLAHVTGQLTLVQF